MNIIDLTDNHAKHILQKSDLAAYEQTMPESFTHYFAFWADKKRFRPFLPNEASVREKRELVQSRLSEIKWRLEKECF